MRKLDGSCRQAVGSKQGRTVTLRGTELLLCSRRTSALRQGAGLPGFKILFAQGGVRTSREARAPPGTHGQIVIRTTRFIFLISICSHQPEEVVRGTERGQEEGRDPLVGKILLPPVPGAQVRAIISPWTLPLVGAPHIFQAVNKASFFLL